MTRRTIRRTTITALRAKGYTCKDRGPRGHAVWMITTPKGKQYEVDLGDEGRWIVAYNEGREGYDAPTLGDALETIEHSGD